MPPPVTSGWVLQFDADDFTGEADGTAIGVAGVTTWVSQAGISSGTQGTAANRPTKQTVNGKTVVRFDGTTDWLSLDGDALTFSQNIAGCTMFAKVKLNSVGTSDNFFVASIGTTTVNRVSIRVGADSNWNTGGRRLDADGFASVGTTAADTSEHVVCGILDFANADAFVFVDGVAAGTDTTFLTAGNTENTASVAASIGADAAGAAGAPIDIKKIIVYNRVLSSVERQAVELYLGVGRPAPTFRHSRPGLWLG